MRKLLALGCALLVPAFLAVAGFAHVHASTHPQADAQGLHLDHGHPGDGDDSDHDHDHGDGDAVSVEAPAARRADPGTAPPPALVAGSVPTPPQATSFDRAEAVTGEPRDPPPRDPPRSRAPPA